MTKGGDCVIIPQATIKATLSKGITTNADQFCGGLLVTADAGKAAATVCSKLDLK
jgi:hypothetical protein